MQRTLVRAAVLGVAVGARSLIGPALLSLTAGASGRGVRPGVVCLAATGELVGDKLPQTPSRAEPPGLLARGVSALVCGAVLARRRGDPPVSAAIAALAGAAAGVGLGVWWRGTGAGRLGVPPLAAAFTEDAFAVSLAALACRAP
jgi:uncharacterized membrane protein